MYACQHGVDIVLISEPYKQLLYWFNHTAGGASLWATLFNGRQAMSRTMICGNGMVGVRVESTMCISGCIAPRILRKEKFKKYMEELESVKRRERQGLRRRWWLVTLTQNRQCGEVGSRSPGERTCWMQSRGAAWYR